MSSPLDLYALTQMPALAAAERLTAASTAELRALCTLCHVRPKPRSDKQELVSLIIAATHPASAPAAPAQYYQQERFV